MALGRGEDARRLARAPESRLAVAGNLAEISLYLRGHGQANTDLEREASAAIREWLEEPEENPTARELEPEPEFRSGGDTYSTHFPKPESLVHEDRAFGCLAVTSRPAWCLRALAGRPREQRLRGLAVMAEEFARQGYQAEAETAAIESLALHEDAGVGRVLEELHMSFASRLAALGAPEDATRIGSLLRNRGRRRHVDVALAAHWLSAGDPVLAHAASYVATAEMPPGKEDRIVVQGAVSTLVDLRDYAGALELARSVQDADARLLGLCLVARRCIEAAVKDEARAAYEDAFAAARALSPEDSLSEEAQLEFCTLMYWTMNTPEDFIDYIAKAFAGQTIDNALGYWMQPHALFYVAECWKDDRLREAGAESLRERLGSAELASGDALQRMAAYGVGARLLQKAGLKREAVEAAANCLAACREGFKEWYSSV
jgi:hypothetical protein